MNAAVLPHPDDIQLQISGMSCASCVTRVETSLEGVPGVMEGVVNAFSSVSVVTNALLLRGWRSLQQLETQPIRSPAHTDRPVTV
ncbi:cation transporter [Piscinibacter koreensis]|nr:cation transporter [Schlegelella koreensis]